MLYLKTVKIKLYHLYQYISLLKLLNFDSMNINCFYSIILCIKHFHTFPTLLKVNQLYRDMFQ